jgi:hypothetical protein
VIGKAGWKRAATDAKAAEIVMLASKVIYWPVKAAKAVERAVEKAAEVAELRVLRRLA